MQVIIVGQTLTQIKSCYTLILYVFTASSLKCFRNFRFVVFGSVLVLASHIARFLIVNSQIILYKNKMQAS